MKERSMRRNALLIAAVGTGILGVNRSALAQATPSQGIVIRPQDVAQLHTGRMNETRNTLDGASPIEEIGLRRLVDFLERQKAIGKIEKDILYELISRVTSAKNIDGLQSTIQEFLKKLGEKAHDLVAAVAGVAQSSAEYVKSIPQAQWDRAMRIVATDLSGALSGGGTGSKWGTSGAVMGAAIGAVSTSITAAYVTAAYAKS